mgnify:FL=1
MYLTVWKWPVVVITVLFLCGCASQEAGRTPSPPAVCLFFSFHDLEITTGQTIYVPAYSEIYYAGGGRTLDLAVTLTIHNTDFSHPIIITSVRYYDTHGQLVKEYLAQPQRLGPLASTDFFVEASEQSGGLGTNFIVEWVAEEAVYEPIVEAIMLNTSAAQGISFTSPGRVIKQLD